MEKQALAEFVGKFKDALLFASGNSVPILPSVRPAFGKYYVRQKLKEYLTAKFGL